MAVGFEWDERKAQSNLRKHSISFDEAATVFADPYSITIADPDCPADEQRLLDIGTSDRERVLVVVYVGRDLSIRIISCRKATRSERKQYEEGWY